MPNKLSRFHRLRKDAQDLLDENVLPQGVPVSRFKKFLHFCVLVWRSFVRNRCPVRASALAYASLLALIPMLAVVVGITSTFLKKEGEDRIDQFIVKFVASITPPAMLSTNVITGTTNVIMAPEAGFLDPDQFGPPPPEAWTPQTVVVKKEKTNQVVLPTFAQDENAITARKTVARNINQFIQNTRSGTLGLTGTVLLIFVAITMLSRIEDTFNDIWGVAHGRPWFTRIFVYWGVISLAPILLIVALGLASGPHLQSTKELIRFMPFIGTLLFGLLPIAVVCITFALIYMLLPNTRVDWRAALVGGVVGGLIFHFNNLMSVLYVSRVISYSKVYGSLGLVP